MSFWVTEYWNIKKTKWWNYTNVYKSRKPSSSIFEMQQKDKKLWTVFLIQLKIDNTIIIVYITHLSRCSDLRILYFFGVLAMFSNISLQ